MFKVGIDIGYGYVKGINERGDMVRFRSMIAPAIDRRIESLFGEQDLSAINKPIQDLTDLHVKLTSFGDAPEEYFVGDLALDSRNATFAFDRNKINHPATKVLLAVATSILTKGVSTPVHLITGLPLDHYFEQKKEFEQALRDVKLSVQHLSGSQKGYSKPVNFDKVTIFVQGGASIYPSLMNPDGTPKQEDLFGNNDLFAIVNIGYRTVDVVVFEAGKRFKPKSDLSFTIDTGVGMIEIRNAVQEAFYNKTGVRLTIPEIEKVIEKGARQYFRGKEIDVSADLMQAKKMVAQNTKDHITANWGNRLDFIRQVYLCGGGALDLKAYLSNFHPNIEVIENSQFADASGYLMVGKLEEMLTELRNKTNQVG